MVILNFVLNVTASMQLNSYNFLGKIKGQCTTPFISEWSTKFQGFIQKMSQGGAKQALQNFWGGSNNHNKHYSISKGGQELSKGGGGANAPLNEALQTANVWVALHVKFILNKYFFEEIKQI